MAAALTLPFTSVWAGTIDSRTEVNNNGLAGIGANPSAVSWIQTVTYQNVVITLDLYNYRHAPNTAAVYLTDAIGPGTTMAANEIAETTVNSSLNFGEQMVTAFSGLTLDPGTYYLTYQLFYTNNDIFTSMAWLDDGNISVATGTGVTDNGAFFGGSIPGETVASFAPATNMPGRNFFQPLFSVTGDMATPEPSTSVCLGGGVGLLLLIGRHRWRSFSTQRRASDCASADR